MVEAYQRIRLIFRQSLKRKVKGKGMKMLTRIASVLVASAIFMPLPAHAVTGGMGQGIPKGFNVSVTNSGGVLTIWQLDVATTSFPAGCTSISIYEATAGTNSYKNALAIVLTAKVAGLPVKFVAIADGSCTFDTLVMF